jgi:hypothetical protein
VRVIFFILWWEQNARCSFDREKQGAIADDALTRFPFEANVGK